MEDQSGDKLTSGGWLAGFPAHLARAILDRGVWCDFAPGDIVYASGAEGDTIWGIASGAMKMFISAGEERMRFCHIVGPGYWFGELELLLNIPRIVEMRMAQPARLLRLRMKDLQSISASFPEIWLSVARLAATNEALAAAAVDDLMLRDPRKRLAATLLRLTGLRWDFQDRPALNPVPVTIQELSEAANLSRSVTARIMSDLTAEGAIEKGYRSVHVTRPDRLVRLM